MNFSPLLGLLFTLLIGYLIVAILVRDPDSSKNKSQKKSSSIVNIDQIAEDELLNSTAPPGDETGVDVDSLRSETRQPVVSLRWVRLSMIFGVGYGITSLLYFTWRALFDQLGWPYFIFEFSVILVLFAFYIRSGLKPRFRVPKGERSNPRNLWHIIIPAAFVLGLVGLITTYFLGTSLYKNGAEDAWMIWNLGARYLTRETPPWINLFSSALADPAEPLMLGSSISRMWVFQGREAPWAPQSIGLIFGLSSVFFSASLITVLRGKVTGLLAGLGVMAASGILILVPAQSVDLPLAFFYLVVGACLYLFDIKLINDPRILIFAGLCTGIGLWTSNNAWLLMLAVIIARIIWVWRNGGADEIFTHWQKYAIGLLPLLTLVLVFRLNYVPNLPNYTDIAAFLNQLFDLNQLIDVTISLFRQLLPFITEKSAPYLLLGIFTLVAGVQSGAFRSKANQLLLGLIITIALLTIVTILVYPPDPILDTAWTIERLFIRLWPLTIFLVILIINLPGIAQDRSIPLQTTGETTSTLTPNNIP